MSGKHGTHRQPDEAHGDDSGEAKHSKTEDDDNLSDEDKLKQQFDDYASGIHPGNR